MKNNIMCSWQCLCEENLAVLHWISEAYHALLWSWVLSTIILNLQGEERRPQDHLGRGAVYAYVEITEFWERFLCEFAASPDPIGVDVLRTLFRLLHLPMPGEAHRHTQASTHHICPVYNRYRHVGRPYIRRDVLTYPFRVTYQKYRLYWDWVGSSKPVSQVHSMNSFW